MKEGLELSGISAAYHQKRNLFWAEMRMFMPTDRPLIGISTPTSRDLAYNRSCWPQYAEAIRQAGAESLEITLQSTPHIQRELLERCAGFVLPGSPADVDPARYGEARQIDTAAPDPARETCDRLILEHAADTGKPVLGICFGMQSINTWRAGTLVQDLTPFPVNHAAGSSVAIAHAVLVANTSLLGSLLSSTEAPGEGPFRRLPVNTSHHQAVSISGENLVVVARCADDGIVEAVEGRIGLSSMLGVQWHPERSTTISAASRSLFLWLSSNAADVSESQGGTTHG